MALRPPGDAIEGKLHFTQRCATCHQLFGEGKTAGPPLDNYDRKSLKFWLPAIIAPSLEIREGFQTYAVLTADGRLLTGVIVAQDPRSITLRTADDKQMIVSRNEVEQLRALETSLMPEDVLKGMQDSEIRDLFAYLSQEQP